MLVPVWETKSSPQLAVFTHVASGTDAQVTPLSCLYAGGITSTRPGWAQASICCLKKNKNMLFLDLECSLSSSVCLCLFFPLAFVSTLAHILAAASCHREQNWEHDQPGKQHICSSRTGDVLCVPIRRSNQARSPRKLSSFNLLPLFPLLLEGQWVFLCDHADGRCYANY